MLSPPNDTARATGRRGNSRRFLLGGGRIDELALVQIVILAAQLKQFLMTALLYKPPLVQDIDPVGIANGTQPMSDDDSRPAP